MKRIWINKTNSFKKAQEFDKSYYQAMSRIERLETMQFLREIYGNINPARHLKDSNGAKKGLKNEGRKGLRRVIKVI